jgi:tetratricopeptide (TPR) repeat protein
VGGGRSFRIDSAEQAVQEALRFAGMVKTPTVTDLEIDVGAGLDQVFSTVSGKVTEGEEVVLFARTHHDLPAKIKVTGRLGGEAFEKSYDTKVEKGAEYGYIPALWARAYLERLMGEGLAQKRGTIISLGLNYGLMTPFTSFLVLESDAAYLQQGIQRRPRYLRVSALGAPADGVEVASAAAAIPLGLFGCSELQREQAPEQEVSESRSSGIFPGAPIATPATSAAQTGGQPPSPADMPVATAAPSMPKKSAGSADELDDLLGGGGGGKDKAERAPMEEGKMGGGRGDASGFGGLGLDGTGRGGGGEGEGTIGLGSLGTIGHGGGGGSGSGYGRGAGGGNKLDMPRRRLATEKPQPDARAEERSQIATGNPYGETEADGAKIFHLTTCSDASRRPLFERRILWSRRLDAAAGAADFLRVFREAGERCELMTWRERKSLLDIIEGRAATAADVQLLLASFAQYPSAANYLRRRITRRALDPEATLGYWFPSGVDWFSVRRGLAALKTPEARVEEVRRVLAGREDDPWGRGLLVEALVGADRTEEAMAEALRLKRDSLASPEVLSLLCDLQAETGAVAEAQRTCSELVEFNPQDPNARRALGDLFLRRGWYEAAYRQYRTLVDRLKEDPLALLRLAAAAAGMGKVDEALRLERKVASGDGEPGPTDPRRFAQLVSAVRVARMLLDAKAKNDAALAESLARNLKKTQAFGRPMTLAILAWEDYAADLSLVLERGGEPLPVAEKVEAPAVGLVAMDIGKATPAELASKVALGGLPLRRAVKFTLYTIAFDGKAFDVSRADGEVKRGELEAVVSGAP